MTTSAEALELRVWEALSAVKDPEIPPLSITDLGLVERVEVAEDAVEVDLLPTFVGCPALDVIRIDVERAVDEAAGDLRSRVRFVYSPPWTSDRITPEGREALRAHGLAPPQRGRVVVPLAALTPSPPRGLACPYCGSTETEVESAFGPTLCRSTHFCRACRNAFEGFKPKPAQ